jgi:hypothetical protein
MRSATARSITSESRGISLVEPADRVEQCPPDLARSDAVDQKRVETSSSDDG